MCKWLRRYVVMTSTTVDCGDELQMLVRIWHNPIHPLNILDDLIDWVVASRLDLAVWEDDTPPYEIVKIPKTGDSQCR